MNRWKNRIGIGLCSILFLLAGCNQDDSKPVATQQTTQAKSVVSPTTPKTEEKAPVVEAPQVKAEVSPQTVKQKTPTSYVGSEGYRKSNNAALEAFDRGDYFGAIVALNEGIVLSPYYDNRGQCIGEGYNYTSQSKSTNIKNFAALSISEEDKQALVGLSGTINSKTRLPLPKVHISLEDSFALVKATKPQYEAPSLKAFGQAFKKLPQNQQDVDDYHNYKAGSFGPYPAIVSAMKAYIANPNPQTELEAASHFTYTYRLMDGTVKTDNTSGLKMKMLFLNPQGFREWLATGGGPKVIDAIKSLPNLSEDQKKAVASLKPDENVDQQLGTPIQDAKYQAIEEGKAFELQLLDEAGNPIDPLPAAGSADAGAVPHMAPVKRRQKVLGFM